MLGVGQFFGPIFGTFFTKKFNFRITTDLCAMVCLASGALYFVVADVGHAFTTNIPKSPKDDVDACHTRLSKHD